MTFGEIVQLAAIYAGFCSSVFVVSYGAGALWRFFKLLADPGYRGD